MKQTFFAGLLVLPLAAVGCSGKNQKIAQAPKPAAEERPVAVAAAPESRPKPAAAAPMSEEEAWFRSATLADLQRRLQDIYFDYDRHDLKPEARSALQESAQWLTAPYNDLAIEVEGHCDERGTLEYNLSLGERRAHAVADYLASLGLASHRVATVSYGKERPECTDAREACWWRNRRSHLRVVSRDGRSLE